MAEMKGLIFEVGRFHLDGQVVHAKTVVKLGAQFSKQFGLQNCVRMYHMGA